MEKRRKTRHASDYLEYGGEEGLPADSMAEAESRYIKDLIRAEIHVEKANEKQEELLQDTAERYGLESSKELDALLRDEYKEKTSKEFLVNGAILTCTNSTKGAGEVPTGGPCGEQRMIGASEGIDMSGSGIEGLDADKVYARLAVTENGFSSDSRMHATVADSRPWVNIPCFGNCRRPADSEAEIKALQAIYLNGSISMPKALKDGTMGTCVCLRKLEERWENAYIPFGSYATFQNGETGEELAGITMTSILFCRHGGFIYPVTSGQEAVCGVAEEENEISEEEQYIKLILETLGWPIENEELHKLKGILDEFDITDQNSIVCFLLICVSESGSIGTYSGELDRNGKPYVDQYGRAVTEYYPEGVNKGYDFEERGVGYMQITLRELQLECLQYLAEQERYGINENKINSNAPGYVEELREFPWEVSAWRWSVCAQTKDNNLNHYVIERVKENNGEFTEGIFLAAESFVNGVVNKEKNPGVIVSATCDQGCGTMNDALAKIAAGQDEWAKKWEVKNGKLYVSGWQYNAPNNWEDFHHNYSILKNNNII